MEDRLIAQLGLPSPATFLIRQFLRRIHPLSKLIKELSFERDELSQALIVSGCAIRFLDYDMQNRPFLLSLARTKRLHPEMRVSGFSLSFSADKNGELRPCFQIFISITLSLQG